MRSRREVNEAVILSGGGAYGEYEAGVLMGLTSGRARHLTSPLDADAYLGTSAGAFNSAFMVANAHEGPERSAEALGEVWTRQIAEGPGNCGNGVYRIRGVPLDSPEAIFKPECLVPTADTVRKMFTDAGFYMRQMLDRGTKFATSTDPLARRLISVVDLSAPVSMDPFVELIRQWMPGERVKASDKVIQLVATNFNKGDIEVFDNDDVGDKAVDNRGVQASAAVPGFFPAVMIRGDYYVDGGVLMNTPIEPAIDLGANLLHVVYMDPDISKIPVERLLNTLDVLDRLTKVEMHLTAQRDDHTDSPPLVPLEFIKKAQPYFNAIGLGFIRDL